VQFGSSATQEFSMSSLPPTFAAEPDERPQDQVLAAPDNFETSPGSVTLETSQPQELLLDISACADEHDGRNLKGVPEFLIGCAKRRGDLSELKFELRAEMQNIGTARPRSDSYPFDYIVFRRQRWTVQVKSTYIKEGNGYYLTVNTSRRRYKRGDFDFLAALVVPWTFGTSSHSTRSRTAGAYACIPKINVGEQG
jgi:hypothetical protein